MQSFFYVNDASNPPNGIHGPIDTREKLKNYDPELYNLIEEVFPCKNNYLKRCNSNRGKQFMILCWYFRKYVKIIQSTFTPA